MKALIITAAFPPLKTGGADFVQRLAAELASRDVQVDVLGPAKARNQDLSVTLHRIDGKWNWRAAQRCISLVRQLEPDVVDIVFTGWMYHDHPMITFLPTMIKKTFSSARIVVHIESLGGIQRDKSNVVIASGRYIASMIIGRRDISYDYGTLLRDSDAIITLSERDRDELCSRDSHVREKSVTIPPPPIMPVIPPLSQEERRIGRQRLGVNDDDALLSFYGYIYPGKGLEALFEAIQSMSERGRKVKLLIVGDEPESYVLERADAPNYLFDLKSLARKLKIEDLVIWSHYAPFGSIEPSSKLRLSDIAVFPFQHGINLHRSSFWFAAAHGLPIIATKSRTTEPIFVDRENVLFARAGDAEDLSQKISSLCIDPILRKTLGENAGVLANQTFSWKSCIDRTLAVFEGIAPNGERLSGT